MFKNALIYVWKNFLNKRLAVQILSAEFDGVTWGLTHQFKTRIKHNGLNFIGNDNWHMVNR